MKSQPSITGSRIAILHIIAILLLLLPLLFLSCSEEIWDQERLVQEIILHPQNVKEICQSSQMDMSEMLEWAMDYNVQLYVSRFEQFDGEYKLKAKNESVAQDDGSIWRYIVITDSNGGHLTVFDFKKAGDRWIIHNISAPNEGVIDGSSDFIELGDSLSGATGSRDR